MRLRSKDLKLAKSAKHHSKVLDHRHSPEHLEDYAKRRLKELGYTLRHKKGPKGWKAKRMSTTLKRTVWLGTNWDKKRPEDRAATLMHELVHARQYREHRRFLARYVADSRFRFAMEAQAYRETVRAYRSMGYGQSSLEHYAIGTPGRFIKSYWILGRRMRKDVHKHMGNIVMRP